MKFKDVWVKIDGRYEFAGRAKTKKRAAYLVNGEIWGIGKRMMGVFGVKPSDIKKELRTSSVFILDLDK